MDEIGELKRLLERALVFVTIFNTRELPTGLELEKDIRAKLSTDPVIHSNHGPAIVRHHGNY